jgi:thiamine-phosphate pyrophosphorylase
VKPAVPKLHAVTDQTVAALSNLESIASTLLSPTGRERGTSSVVALHARIPHADGRLIHDLAMRLGRTRGAVFVNDRVDVARIVRAAGAHLPSDGLPIKAARAVLTGDQLLGRSVHSSEEAREALDEGADYVFLGPIWETSSHPGRPGLGVGAFKGLASLPIIAIGGITAERARLCRDAGAWGVAAISALWHAPDPAAAARAMLLSFDLTPGRPLPPGEGG